MKEQNCVAALLDSESAYRWLLLRILEFCTTPQGYLDVQEYVLALLRDKVGIHSADVLLMWLEENGGLERVTLDKEGKWITTSAGIEAIALYSQGQALRNLLAINPEYLEVFQGILKLCVQPRRRDEIEEMLAGDAIVQHSILHPAYFVSELEKYGGLEWSDKRWHTTPDGKGVIE